MRPTSWRPALISRAACGRSAGCIRFIEVPSKKHGLSRMVSSPDCSMRTTASTSDSATLLPLIERAKPASQLCVRLVDS